MTILKQIEAQVKKDKPGIIKMMKKFVEIPTVNPPGLNFKKMVDSIGSAWSINWWFTFWSRIGKIKT